MTSPQGQEVSASPRARTDMFRILADLCDRVRDTPRFEMLDISDDVTKALAVVTPPVPSGLALPLPRMGGEP